MRGLSAFAAGNPAASQETWLVSWGMGDCVELGQAVLAERSCTHQSANLLNVNESSSRPTCWPQEEPAGSGQRIAQLNHRIVNEIKCPLVPCWPVRSWFPPSHVTKMVRYEHEVMMVTAWLVYAQNTLPGCHACTRQPHQDQLCSPGSKSTCSWILVSPPWILAWNVTDLVTRAVIFIHLPNMF